MPLLSIPTKPFLRKYIQYNIGAEYLQVDGKHPIEMLLTALLEKKKYHRDAALENRYRDKIQRIAPLPVFDGYLISPRRVIYFNDYVQMLFANDLVHFCTDYLKWFEFGNQLVDQITKEYDITMTERERRKFVRVARLDEGLLAFADKIGLEIEVDITFDYLKKIEYRTRQAKKNELFSKPVPHFGAGQLRIEFA